MRESDVSQNVEEAYSYIAEDYKSNIKSHNLDHRYIERFLTLFNPQQKILDVGVGTGTISEEMQTEHQLMVTAIDLSEEMIAVAKANYPDLTILKMDLRKLAFADQSFDGAFANYSLIHVAEADVPLSLQEVARVVKPGGYLYLALQEPITPMDKDGYYPVAYKNDVKMFINLFTEAEITNYLATSGFQVKNIDRRSPEKETEFPFNKLFVTAQRIM